MEKKMKKGYTASELCIVLAVLFLISLFLVPQLGQASIKSKEQALDLILSNFNQQIYFFKKDHHNNLPRLDRISFQQAICGSTDKFGAVYSFDSSVIGLKKFGPYLNEIPANPFNEKNTVRINGRAAGANTHGWRYDSCTGEIKSDFPIKKLKGI